ncbi:ribonuclease E inhibitor RraB [Albirhodobacter sp. R86504]|jgi:hypothetical protein|uniref:ribonuclease E inhibitor RraB n=1 Tax=Albirhodobacter sp. R86504 TaxID=3093848 RepID=UPI00366C333F
MDLSAQKTETEAIFEQIRADHGLPASAVVSFQFVDDEGAADFEAFIDAVEAAGYAADWIEDEDCVEVTTGDEPLTVEGLWTHEERLTVLADGFGLEPDGWGFFGG